MEMLVGRTVAKHPGVPKYIFYLKVNKRLDLLEIPSTKF